MSKQISFYNEKTGQNYLVEDNDTQRISNLTTLGFRSDYNPDVLNSAALESTPSINYSNPQYPVPTNIKDIYQNINPTDLGPTESSAQDLTNRLIGINNTLSGKSTFTTQQENLQNIGQLKANQRSITSQILGLSNEQADLINQYNYTIPNQVQEFAKGRNMTKAGTGIMTAGELRKNQISQGELASRSLVLQAQLYAAQDDLANAQDSVDRAVKEKYGAIEAEQATMSANLKLIMDSPNFSLEDKNRAAKQAELVKEQDAQIAQDKQNMTDILDIVTDAAQKGAKALTLKQMREAKTPQEAVEIATNANVYTNAMSNATVQAWQQKYPDAGILPTDDITTATEKLKNSEIYQNEINPQSWSVQTDAEGNQFMFNTKTGQISQLGATGDYGGECGEYINNTYGTAVGDKWEDKQKISNTSLDEFRKTPQVNDIIIFKTKMPYGHIAAITAINGDKITLTESNWDKTNGDGKIGTRTISVNDPTITGIYRGATPQEGSVPSAEQNDIQNALKAILPRLTSEQKKSAYSQVNKFLRDGDTEGAKQAIISLAISALPTEQQNKAFGRYQAIDALNDISQELANYKSSGGNTNILKGTEESIMQKLGNTTDPKLATIASKITMAMIAYRNAVSGAAFTESEAKQYEKLFPGINKNGELNTAKVDSLISEFTLNNKSALGVVLGQKNYDALFKQSVKTMEDDWASGESNNTLVIDTTEDNSTGQGFFGRLAKSIIGWFK